MDKLMLQEMKKDYEENGVIPEWEVMPRIFNLAINSCKQSQDIETLKAKSKALKSLLVECEPELKEKLRKHELNHNPSSIFNNHADDIERMQSLLTRISERTK